MQTRNAEQVNRKLVFEAGDPKIKDKSNEGRNVNIELGGAHIIKLCRQACSSHFGGFEIGQSPIFGGLPDFVLFFSRLCKPSDISCGGWG